MDSATDMGMQYHISRFVDLSYDEAVARATEDCQEGIAAFAQKRSPEFKGR